MSREKYHSQRGNAIGETRWNDHACLEFARATFGPRAGSPADRIDRLLDAIEGVPLGDLAAQLGLPRKARQFIEPIADLTVSDLTAHAGQRVISQAVAELER